MTEEVLEVRVPGICSAAGTDVGLVRRLNEDAFLNRPDLGLWVVADGMGGHHAGDHASRTIVEALGTISPPQSGGELMAQVRGALERANAALLDHAEQLGERTLVASTVVCLLIFGEHYACVWAGDSRLYILREGLVLQVSRDHSLVQEMVDAGQIDSEMARHHPSGNKVTRAVGVMDLFEPEVVFDDLYPNDAFLLCSDGITRLMEDVEIGAILAESTPGEAVRRLIDLTLERGAPDNATAVIIKCETVSRKETGESASDDGDDTTETRNIRPVQGTEEN
jgi:serine/threonine protein phosphatase PrpC